MKTSRLACSLVLALAACDATIESEPSDTSDELTGQGRHYHYVVNQITLAKTVAEAGALAFDLDGDGRPDNQLGYVVASVASSGIDLQPLLDTAIQGGSVVLLGSLQANRLANDPTVTWQGFVGDPQPDPILTGDGVFSVAATSPRDAIISGAIKGSVFAGGPGIAVLPLPAVGPFPAGSLRMYHARATMSCATKGCSGGRIGGVIRVFDRDTVIYPLMAAVIDAKLAADGCPGSCTPSDLQILSLFDTDHDGQVSAAEFGGNLIVQTIMAPDVDLDGDGVKDGLSFAYGFTAAHATFKVAE